MQASTVEADRALGLVDRAREWRLDDV